MTAASPDTCTFPYDADRAHNAVLWLLKRHGHLDHIKVLKLVVLADIRHLVRYGRPIVGGRYFAMHNGPVASELYDELKVPTIPGVQGFPPHFVRGVADPDEDQLSESDLEVLQEINEEYGKWDTFKLSDHTHQLQTWKRHYVEGSHGAFPMPYEEMLKECLDNPMLDIVHDDQQAERILG